MLPVPRLLDQLPALLAGLSTLQAIAALAVVAGALHTVRRVSHRLLASKSDEGNSSREPPFPKSTRFLVANTVDLVRNDPRLYDWLTELCLEFGGRPFRIEAFGLAQTTMLSSPDDIEQVLKTDFDNFEKGRFVNEVLEDLLGRGIFASDGATWHHQRKTVSHLFTMRTLRETMTTLVHKHLTGLVDAFEASAIDGTAFDLSNKLHDFTLKAIMDMALGVDLTQQQRHSLDGFPAAFDAAIRQLSFRLSVPRALWKFQRYWDLGGEAALKRNIKIVHDAALDVISESLTQRQHEQPNSTAQDPHCTPPRPNLVSLFLDSFDRERERDAETTGPVSALDKPFDPTYLRDIVLNIMVAGRDTTAQTLAWFFHCLNQHPHVTTKIRHEIHRLAPELINGPSRTSSGAFASMEQVAKLPYLDAAIKETLRLYPAVPLNIRTTVRDTVLADGTLLKTGTLVGLPTYALGRMPHVWGPDATAFDPDRWFDADTGKPRVVSAFQFSAFHGGPRQCIGQQLAMLEMKIVAVALLTRYDVVVEPGQCVTYARSLTLPMKDPFMVKATRRTPQ